MVSKNVIVTCPNGIHARNASEIVQFAMQCRSELMITVGERRVNPKEIFSLMAASIKQGDELILQCSGENEQEDLEKLGKLFL
ncbi:MAG: HPr family phosphocarrier protein [Lachnospiraceae bacterium]|nr:HPr family phosphocarrier protein [Lachnospiraceae bacterium]